VVVDLTGLTRSAADNTQVYVFDNSGANNFHHKVLQITRPEENTLMMPMPEGTWDLALVATPDGSGMNSVLSPVVGLPRSGQKMLELIPTGDLLPPAPELAMGSLDDQTIAPHIDNTAPPVSLVRNVALVRLTIQSPRNYSMIPGAQKVTLGNIPTTLDWNGKLLPDKNSPRTGGTARMEGFFDIIELADSGDQECSRVEFVIPANREDSSADISTHKIDVQVSLDIAGQPYISTIKEIDKAPRANMILDVTLVIGAELTMEADILPWDDTTPVQGIDIDPVPQTTLRVNKTQMMLSQATDWRDDLLTVVATSNGDYVHPSVEHGELWLTSNWIGNVLHLGIDRENYPWNPPATTFITLNVDNGFKKRINVSKPEITTPRQPSPSPPPKSSCGRETKRQPSPSATSQPPRTPHGGYRADCCHSTRPSPR
jgi:hypothetical protein